MSISDADFGLQVGIGILGKVVMALVAFLGSIVLARILGPDGYGTYYLLMAVIALLSKPAIGWADACRKRLTEAGFSSEEAIGSTLVGILGSTAIVFAGSWILSDFITERTGLSSAWYLLSFLYLGAVAFSTSIQVLMATEKFGSSTWVEAGRDVLRVGVQIGLVISGLGLIGMVSGMVLANLVIAPIIIFIIGARPMLPTRSTLGAIWGFARSGIPNSMIGTAIDRMDVILLGAVTGASAVGNYEVAFRMTMPAMFVAGIAASGLMGRISNLESKGKTYGRDIQNNLGYASVFAIPLFFGALVIGKPIVVTAYSSKFAEAGAYIAGLALFRLTKSQDVILSASLNGLDRPDLNLKTSLGIFIVNILLGVLLLYSIGPIGVIIATVLSGFLGYVLHAYFLKSLVPSTRVITRPFLQQTLSGAVMAAVVYVAKSLISPSTWPIVISLTALGGLVYFSSLLVFSIEFRKTIRAIAADAGM